MKDAFEQSDFIKMDHILKNPELYYAHRDGKKKTWETLEEHTALCQRYFTQIYEHKKIGDQIRLFRKDYLGESHQEAEVLMAEMFCNIVTFHDIGKHNPNFQRNILERKEVEKKPSYRAAGNRHSILSSVLYMDYYDKRIREAGGKLEKKLCALLLCNAYAIARHHSGLISLKDFIESLLYGCNREILEIYQQESFNNVYAENFTFNKDRLKKFASLVENIQKIMTKRQGIWLYFYGRLAYSVLVASDYYATSAFMSGTKMEKEAFSPDLFSHFAEIHQQTKVNQSIRAYELETYPMNPEQLEKETQINVLRNEIFLDAERTLQKENEKNIFYLEAPTGSGKSNMAVHLSLQMAKKDKRLNKIYYVYPFNTLVEQNQEILQEVFKGYPEIWNKIAVINSITPVKCVENGRNRDEEEEKDDYYEKALLNRQFLNYSMILTTHVSFFDTLFGDSKESAFAFYQLAGSIVVLDEIQSYKNEIWGEIITFLTELTEFLHMKIIIMSATLPNLEILKEKSEQACYLIPERKKYFEHPCFKERVAISDALLKETLTMESLYQHMKQNCGKHKKILVEFIKKDRAEEFYRMCKEDEEIEEKIFCMTGDDSIFERKKIIGEIKKKNTPIILISTQVIEAGVDIDMDIGYKNIGKMDSEEQFLGRINRSYSKGRTGIVYFFQIDVPKKIYKNDIRVGWNFLITQPEIWEMLKTKDFESYYKRVLEIWKKNYAERAVENFFSEQVMQLDFPNVKKWMQLIDERCLSISVYLGRVLWDEESGELIDGNEIWKEYETLLRNTSMGYAEKTIKLSSVMAKMNCFIYQIHQRQIQVSFDEQIGELFYIQDGEKYFKDGRLNRTMIQGQLGDGIDFI